MPPTGASVRPAQTAREPLLPGVGVCMPTYNHGEFIAKAIDSVMAQQTDLPIRLYIGDDASTDATRAIIQSYAAKDSRIEAHVRPKNLGVAANVRELYGLAARHQYVAWLEGDDFWISRNKLASQAMFLQRTPSASACFHAVDVVDEHARLVSPAREPCSSFSIGLEDLLLRNEITTCSVMWRGGLVPSLPETPSESQILDIAIHAAHLHYGPAHWIPGLRAAYRVHSGGVWSGAGEQRRLRSMMSASEGLRSSAPPEFGYLFQLRQAEGIARLAAFEPRATVAIEMLGRAEVLRLSALLPALSAQQRVRRRRELLSLALLPMPTRWVGARIRRLVTGLRSRP